MAQVSTLPAGFEIVPDDDKLTSLPEGFEIVSDTPKTDKKTGVTEKAIRLALPVVSKAAELASKGVSTAWHHPVETATALATGKYLEIPKKLSTLANALAPYAGAAAGHAMNGLSSVNNGLGALASSAEAGGSALLPLLLTSQQGRLQQAINDALTDKTKIY